MDIINEWILVIMLFGLVIINLGCGVLIDDVVLLLVLDMGYIFYVMLDVFRVELLL